MASDASGGWKGRILTLLGILYRSRLSFDHPDSTSLFSPASAVSHTRGGISPPITLTLPDSRSTRAHPFFGGGI